MAKLFCQVNDSPYGTVLASHLTAVAAKDNFSATVEVKYKTVSRKISFSEHLGSSEAALCSVEI